MADEKVEAPERIWLQLRPWGYGPYWYEKLPNGTESVEYTRSSTNTRQRAERAAAAIGANFDLGDYQRMLTDIIAEEFEK